MSSLQDLVYKIENLRDRPVWRVVLGALLALGLAVAYNHYSFHNLNSPEAMDAAQLGRNLSEGRGYTTQFIRPLSIYLVKERNEAKGRNTSAEVAADPARLKGTHPDLANPPVYPVMLAGLMKFLPFKYSVKTPFSWYQPDFLIALFNQALLLASVVLTFFLARRLFDNQVAWLTAILMLGCELLWRFSMSGLSTQLLLLIFLGLVWCLVWLEREAREPAWRPSAQLGLAGAVGLLLGLGALTRYAFGWLLIPVLIYLGVCCVARRLQVLLIALGVFLAVLSPWVARNVALSGTPFGTASYAVYETTNVFPEDKLQRSLEPNLTKLGLRPFVTKLAVNSREILQNDLPKLGGSWVSALFLTGLLLGYRNPALRRLRLFLVGTLLVFIVVQALGRTQLSVDSPVINGENLLVLTVPLVLLFGTGLFFQLLDQMSFGTRELRYAVIGLFGLVACLPMVYSFLPPKSSPVAYPPYYPPVIQLTSDWMQESELMMSDVPWAVAWYGNRQCVSYLESTPSEFYAIHDFLKPIRGLYLSPLTMNSRLLSQWLDPGKQNQLPVLVANLLSFRLGPDFPLRSSAPGFLPGQVFLSNWERWKNSPTGPVSPPTEEPGASDKSTPKAKDAEKK